MMIRINFWMVIMKMRLAQHSENKLYRHRTRGFWDPLLGQDGFPVSSGGGHIPILQSDTLDR